MADAWNSWEDMPLEEFEARAARIRTAAKDFIALVQRELPGLPTLPENERPHFPRLREGEHDAFEATLEAAEVRPAAFESLGNEDEGMNPNQFETALLRTRITKHRILRGLIDDLEPTASQLNDAALVIADKFDSGCRAAYRIARTLANTDRQVRDKLARAIDFYSRIAAKGARTRSTKG